MIVYNKISISILPKFMFSPITQLSICFSWSTYVSWFCPPESVAWRPWPSGFPPPDPCKPGPSRWTFPCTCGTWKNTLSNYWSFWGKYRSVTTDFLLMAQPSIFFSNLAFCVLFSILCTWSATSAACWRAVPWRRPTGAATRRWIRLPTRCRPSNPGRRGARSPEIIKLYNIFIDSHIKVFS